jgi:hypothetical protein
MALPTIHQQSAADQVNPHLNLRYLSSVPSTLQLPSYVPIARLRSLDAPEPHPFLGYFRYSDDSSYSGLLRRVWLAGVPEAISGTDRIACLAYVNGTSTDWSAREARRR